MNDADIEMRELEIAANRIARLKRRGICCHGWYKTIPIVRCNECGKEFPDVAALHEERDQLL